MMLVQAHGSALSSLGFSRTVVCSRRGLLAGLILIGGAAYIVKRIKNKKRTALIVKAFNKDELYLISPTASTPFAPRLSAFGFKLETYMRLVKRPYTGVKAEWGQVSHKGQIPFVEYNGVEVADSNMIIEWLKRDMNLDLDEGLNDEQKATSTALCYMFENSFTQPIAAYSYCKRFPQMASYFLTAIGVGWFFRTFMAPPILWQRKRFVKKFYYQVGITRHSDEEILQIFESMLSAVSTLLGDKAYLFGDRVSTADVYMFTYISQVLTSPVLPELRDIVRREDGRYSNLERHFESMRQLAWPDWDDEIAKARKE